MTSEVPFVLARVDFLTRCHRELQETGLATMPLVFVHGVGHRIDGPHVQQTRALDDLFRSHLLSSHVRADGRPVSIRNPYWGGTGSSLAWGGASIGEPRRPGGLVGRRAGGRAARGRYPRQ
jgi:hypothetical protein